jgi:hypothetical protein
MRVRLATIAIALAWPPSASGPVPDRPLSAIVRIYSTVKAAAGFRLGAGVFIDGGGTVLTAYHVVQGATDVTVISDRGDHGKAALVSFDAARDIATIRVRTISGPADYLALATSQQAQNLSSRPAIAYGHPDGKLNYSVPIHFPREGPVLSKSFSAAGSKQIFAVEDVNIIPILGVINPGMSGGPVVIQGKVISIISGTQAPSGADFGWSIPVSYVDQLRPAGSYGFDSLPPPRLLKSGSDSTLHKSSLNVARQEELGRIFSQLAASALKQESVSSDVYRILGELSVLVNRAATGSSGLAAIDALRARDKSATVTLLLHRGMREALIAANQTADLVVSCQTDENAFLTQVLEAMNAAVAPNRSERTARIGRAATDAHNAAKSLPDASPTDGVVQPDDRSERNAHLAAFPDALKRGSSQNLKKEFEDFKKAIIDELAEWSLLVANARQQAKYIEHWLKVASLPQVIDFHQM